MKKLYFLIGLIFSKAVLAVDINTASVEELASELSNVGPVKAKRIVEYREKIGGFVSPEELMEVKGIGPKTLERNRDKIEISPHKPQPNMTADKSITDASLDLSPKVAKTPQIVHNLFWDALIIIPMLIACLFIFAIAWYKGTKKDKQMLRKHLVSTTFTCSRCGKISHFQNIRYEDHFSIQYIDGDLPPGWSCIPNWQGKPCDYCFDCSGEMGIVNWKL